MWSIQLCLKKKQFLEPSFNLDLVSNLLLGIILEFSEAKAEVPESLLVGIVLNFSEARWVCWKGRSAKRAEFHKLPKVY